MVLILQPKLSIPLKIVIVFIIIFTLLIILSMIHRIGESCALLYKLSPVFLAQHTELLKTPGRIPILDHFRLSFFVETVHPKRYWSFKMASIGAINHRFLMKAFPTITSFMLFIYGFVKN